MGEKFPLFWNASISKFPPLFHFFLHFIYTFIFHPFVSVLNCSKCWSNLLKFWECPSPEALWMPKSRTPEKLQSVFQKCNIKEQGVFLFLTLNVELNLHF